MKIDIHEEAIRNLSKRLLISPKRTQIPEIVITGLQEVPKENQFQFHKDTVKTRGQKVELTLLKLLRLMNRRNNIKSWICKKHRMLWKH